MRLLILLLSLGMATEWGTSLSVRTPNDVEKELDYAVADTLKDLELTVKEEVSENRFLAASMEDLEQVIRNLAHTGEMSEDEALEHLYYRKSMKGLSQIELQKALGRLLKKRSVVTDTLVLKKINGYINQIKNKLK